jgi:hypothetical protein
LTQAITKADLKNSLVNKFGFVPSEGGSHERVSLWVDGKKVATTYFSRNLRSTQLSPSLLRQIAGQLRLDPGSLPTLRGMVLCTVSRDDYLRELRDEGFLN